LFDKFFEKKIEKALNAKKAEIDSLDHRQHELLMKIAGLEEYISKWDTTAYKKMVDKNVETIQDYLQEIWKDASVSVKENIDTVLLLPHLSKAMRQIAEDTLTKTRIFNSEADTWIDELFLFKINPEKRIYFIIPADVGITFYAVKFLGGKGYGRYQINVNGVHHSGFLKRENGNEDGVILFYHLRFCQANDRVKIYQTYGEGELQAALKFFVAGRHTTIFPHITLKTEE